MVTGEIIEDMPWSEYGKDPLTAVIDTQQGVVARWQALRHLSEKAIRHRLESGRWRRVHRTVYVTYGGHITLAQRHWIAILAANPGPSIRDSTACLSGLSALQVHGLRNLTSTQVHLLIPASRKVVAPPGVVVHRSREFPAEDRHPAALPPTTTLGRAVVDAASWARSDKEARLVVAASFQQRLVTAAPEIEGVLRRMRNVPRHHLIKETADDASGGSHTLGELALVKICREEGLPLPTRQVKFRDLAGRVRFLDAVFDRWRVAVEIDGVHHDDVRQRWDDAERDNALILATYNILRYPSHVLRDSPREVAAQIRAALMTAGWRPRTA